MSNSKDKENERAYDIRIVERNIRRGIVSRKDLDKFIKGLPDSANNAVRLGDLEPEEHHGNSVNSKNSVD